MTGNIYKLWCVTCVEHVTPYSTFATLLAFLIDQPTGNSEYSSSGASLMYLLSGSTYQSDESKLSQPRWCHTSLPEMKTFDNSGRILSLLWVTLGCLIIVLLFLYNIIVNIVNYWWRNTWLEKSTSAVFPLTLSCPTYHYIADFVYGQVLQNLNCYLC